MNRVKWIALQSAFVALSFSLHGSDWYAERLYPDWGQTFRVEEMILEKKGDDQDIVIFNNANFGKVMAIDGLIQMTEKDEFCYHEMIAHVPLFAHGDVKNVLIIGGGDGGTLREVLRHQEVENVVLVEIDPSVIDFSKEQFPMISDGAFDDPRLSIVIQDGSLYVKETQDVFDVIICDSCDPVGPAAVLFTEEFFGDCQKILSERGIFVNQSGIPFMKPNELTSVYHNLSEHFVDVGCYLGVTPTYAGGYMAFGFASNDPGNRKVSAKVLRARLEGMEGDLKYYTPSVHKASFALPKFIEDLLAE